VRLVRSQPNLDAMPELHAWLQDEQGRSFQLLGMDLFNPAPCAALWRRAGQPTLLVDPRRQRLAGAPEAAPWLANGPEPAFVLGGGEGAPPR
jgi:putative ABC transport system permease protein